jgi:hypothetical protein
MTGAEALHGGNLANRAGTSHTEDVSMSVTSGGCPLGNVSLCTVPQRSAPCPGVTLAKNAAASQRNADNNVTLSAAITPSLLFSSRVTASTSS